MARLAMTDFNNEWRCAVVECSVERSYRASFCEVHLAAWQRYMGLKADSWVMVDEVSGLFDQFCAGIPNVDQMTVWRPWV